MLVRGLRALGLLLQLPHRWPPSPSCCVRIRRRPRLLLSPGRHLSCALPGTSTALTQVLIGCRSRRPPTVRADSSCPAGWRRPPAAPAGCSVVRRHKGRPPVHAAGGDNPCCFESVFVPI